MIGISLTPIVGLSFKRQMLETKRGLMLVNGEKSLFIINRQRRIYAVATQKNDSVDIDNEK